MSLTPIQRALLLKHYAPLVLLHPHEKYLPYDPAAAFAASTQTSSCLSIPETTQKDRSHLSNDKVRAPVTAQVVENANGKAYLQVA